jgi:hypothetical protein
MKEELRRPRFSSSYYTRNVGAGVAGHAALVVDGDESRTIDSNAGRVTGRGPDAIADAFV